MYNSCISSWKRLTTKCKFSAWKVIILEMECKSGCQERKNLHQFNGHLQHWTEAETKSDSQVESFINVAKSKLISWVSYITTKLRTDCYNNQSSVHIYAAKLETKRNLYLDTTAKLVPEQFSFETKTGKSFIISGRF